MNIFKRFFVATKFFLGNSIPMMGWWGWDFPGGWGKGELLDQYKGYVYTVVSAIAQEAAKVEFEIKRGEVVQKNHPFIQLIKKPNPQQSQFQFLELHFTFMKIVGESYWYVASGSQSGQPKQLYILPPANMEVVVDKESPVGEVVGYVFTRPADGARVPFDYEEILHFKMPNPKDPYYGLGPIQAGKTYIQTEDFASDWTKHTLYNSGRPSGIVNVKGAIGKEEFDSLKKQYKDSYSGTKNAGKTMFIKGADGIDYQKLGMELGEVALKELKDMTRDDIMIMYRVSKTILGISDDVNRANALEARAVFARNVVMPELDRFTDHITAFLLPRWPGDYTLDYKDMVMRSDEDRLNEWDKGHNRWLTTNDIRKESGRKPIPGGDVLYQSVALVPVTAESETPPEPQSDQGPNGDNGQDNGDGKGDSGKGNDNKKSKKKIKKSVREQRADVFMRLLFDLQIAWEKKYKQIVVREFNTQEKEILNNNKDAFPSWIFDVAASKSRLIGNLTPLSLQLLKEASKHAFELADDPERVLEMTPELREFIKDRIDRLVTATNDETIRQIEDTIASGVKDGEAVSQLRNRIRDVYDQATKIRAERIARTETLSASNEGALEAYKQSPLVEAKEWSAEFDACEFCLSFNGKIVGLTENFANVGSAVQGEDGGNYNVDYTDIETPPLHPNCRCAILPVAQS